MERYLVIVESPAKTKTIEKYLGKEYTVMASYGHVRDLAKKDFGVDINNNYSPTYVISPDKTHIIKDLKAAIKKVDKVYIATDPDREGEAIAWHLKEALKLKDTDIERVVFNEITKDAVIRAFQDTRTIDLDLVNAQQARRVLDRLVGFEMSPLLWKKVKAGLSAGRVQSVAVRLCVDREREIMAFTPESFYKVTGVFNGDGFDLDAQVSHKFETKDQAVSFLNSCETKTFAVDDVVKKDSKRQPSAPFITSSLQQEASTKLGYSVSRTMSLAQRLYEEGHITYMRTDSTSLSDLAITMASKEIKTRYGDKYLETRQFATKSQTAQEAHEAIRPTNFGVDTAGNDDSEKKLYHLIWRRTMASQMAPALFERSKATLSSPGVEFPFAATGEIQLFDGFLKVYSSGEDALANALPEISVGASLSYDTIVATQKFTKPTARYSEASLVKTLEELGIGRPSTYAPIISTIQKREYVEKRSHDGVDRDFTILILDKTGQSETTETEKAGSDSGRLTPLDIGMVVTDFLAAHFDRVMDYHFTADIEEDLDKISHGKREWSEMIDAFYTQFHEKIVTAEATSERASGERQLGEDPVSGRPLSVRIGRYGPLAQIGVSDDETPPRYASLRKEQSLETITLEEALDLFKLPRDLGQYEGKDVQAAIGRYGPYIRFDSLFVSLKEDDPYTIELDRAIELIKVKKEEDANKYIHVFDEHDPTVQVIRGRYGPYISIGKRNIKIPKGTDPESLTLEACLELEKTAPPPRKRKKK